VVKLTKINQLNKLIRDHFNIDNLTPWFLENKCGSVKDIVKLSDELVTEQGSYIELTSEDKAFASNIEHVYIDDQWGNRVVVGSWLKSSYIRTGQHGCIILHPNGGRKYLNGHVRIVLNDGTVYE
jgi:hypothetical protein